LTGKTAQTPFV